MDINGIRSADMLSSIYAAAYAPPMQGNSINSQSSGSTENLEISAIGNLMNAISQMSDDDKASVQSFMGELTASVQDGTFDAESMAAVAPEALTSYAEENGIDLAALIQEMADGMENSGGVYGPPPPPPPMMYGSNGIGTESFGNQGIDFFSQLFSQIGSDDTSVAESV